MALPAPKVDYCGFRLRKINQPEYRHAWGWLFWPLLGLRYILIERFIIADQHHVVHCAVDDMIPFCEAFVIPYGIWYVFLFGMHLYTFFYDVQAFKRYTKYLTISFSISTTIFLLFPTCQNLRPTAFPRDNVLTNIVGALYVADTNTNVCPSEHVIGSIAVFSAALNTESLRTPKRLTLIGITAFFTSICTVFLKQHSFVDVLAAIPVCLLTYWFCYGKEKRTLHREKRVLSEATV